MWQQSRSIAFDELDVEVLRVRMQKLSDNELVKYDKAARYICSPGANLEHPPRKAFSTAAPAFLHG